MAKIKPAGQITGIGSHTGGVKNVDISKPLSGAGSMANGIGVACDLIGMSEIPIVDQGACVIGAIVYTAAGQPTDALLSLGSLAPGAGKVADAAKIARMANKGIKVAEVTSKSAKVAENSTKVAKSSKEIKQFPNQPSKTKAKSASTTPAKETNLNNDLSTDKVDEFGESIFSNQKYNTNNWGNSSIFTQSKKIPGGQNLNYRNVPTNSNQAANNVYRSTGSPLSDNVRSAGNLFGL